MCSNKELTWNGVYQGASVIKKENISLYDNFYVKSETYMSSWFTCKLCRCFCANLNTISSRAVSFLSPVDLLDCLDFVRLPVTIIVRYENLFTLDSRWVSSKKQSVCR